MLPILVRSWKSTIYQTPKDFYHTNGSSTQIIWTTKNCLQTKPFVLYNEIAILLKKKCLDYEKLLCTNLTTETAPVKIRLSGIPLYRAKDYSYLESVEAGKKQFFKDFLRWYNRKGFVAILEAMLKMVDFHHNKGIVMHKLEYTLPNLAKLCLHSSTSAKFYPFTESDENLVSKNREDIFLGPLKVFTGQTVFDESHFR